MFQVAAQLRNETIRVKRWLLDVYGYGDYEPVLEDVYHVEYLSELMVISSKQIMELAREYKAGDPDDQPEYKSPWLAGHRKRHGWRNQIFKQAAVEASRRSGRWIAFQSI